MEEVYCAQGCGHEERRHLACLPFPSSDRLLSQIIGEIRIKVTHFYIGIYRHLPYTFARVLYYSRSNVARSRQVRDGFRRYEAHAKCRESHDGENVVRDRKGQCL